MWGEISRQFAGLMGRLFGPSAASWAEENGVPVFGLLGLIVFGLTAVGVRVLNREVVETDTLAGRQRNRRFGRGIAAVLFATGVALLGRSLTFGSFGWQKVQEVVWSLAAAALGTTAWALLLAWWRPTLTPGEQWKMRAGLVVPVALGIVFVVVGATRSPPPPPPPSPEEVVKAKEVVSRLGGRVVGTDPKTGAPTAVAFRKRMTTSFEDPPEWAPPGPRIFKRTDIPLRDDDLPPLLDALRVLHTLKTVDVSDTALSASGVDRVRAALPGVGVVGPPS